jgi:hypothetical protein
LDQIGVGSDGPGFVDAFLATVERVASGVAADAQALGRLISSMLPVP